MSKELTQPQLDRQDAVDNAIQELLESLSGKKFPCLDWDTEIVGIIRDAVQEVICKRMELMTPLEFYPYIDEDTNPILPTPEPKGKLYIDVDGGNITGVYGPAGLECLIIDADNGDVDEDTRAENERKQVEEEAAIDSGAIVELY